MATKKSSQSRKNRRTEYSKAGFLKIKNMFGRFSPQAIQWYAKMSEDGKAAHEANVKRGMDATEERLQSMLNSLKVTWDATGYSAEEIAKLEEAWTITAIKDKETYRADKKLAKSLRKEAQDSFISRKDANS